MRDRRDVLDGGNADAERIERTHRRFAAGTRAPNANFDVLQTMFEGDLAGLVGSDLSGERGRLTRALEALSTGGRRSDGVALAVGNRDDGVVEVLTGTTLGSTVEDTNVLYNDRYSDVTSDKPAYTYSVSGINDQKTAATVSITFNFLWSSVFNYDNPVLIDKGSSDYTVPQNVSDGLKAIDKINDNSNEIKIGLKLFVTVNE